MHPFIVYFHKSSFRNSWATGSLNLVLCYNTGLIKKSNGIWNPVEKISGPSMRRPMVCVSTAAVPPGFGWLFRSIGLAAPQMRLTSLANRSSEQALVGSREHKLIFNAVARSFGQYACSGSQIHVGKKTFHMCYREMHSLFSFRLKTKVNMPP